MYFLELPGELRNEIYSYIIPSRFELTYDGHIKRPKDMLNLSLICRQIWLEVRFLPFSTSTFSAMRLDILRRWLSKTTPDQQEAIKHIEFRFFFDAKQPTVPSYLYHSFESTKTKTALLLPLRACLGLLPGLTRITLRGNAWDESVVKKIELEEVRMFMGNLKPGVDVISKMAVLGPKSQWRLSR